MYNSHCCEEKEKQELLRHQDSKLVPERLKALVALVQPGLARPALHSDLDNLLSLYICPAEFLCGWEAAQPLGEDHGHDSVSPHYFFGHVFNNYKTTAAIK